MAGESVTMPILRAIGRPRFRWADAHLRLVLDALDPSPIPYATSLGAALRLSLHSPCAIARIGRRFRPRGPRRRRRYGPAMPGPPDMSPFATGHGRNCDFPWTGSSKSLIRSLVPSAYVSIEYYDKVTSET